MVRSHVHTWAAAAGILFALWAGTGAVPGWRGVSHAQSEVILNVDVPSAGTAVSVGDKLFIGGWAVDPSERRSAVDPLVRWVPVEVRAYLDGPPSVGTYVGMAQSGTLRPDVANAFGRPEWANSGFALDWVPQRGSAGVHTLYVQAVSSSGGTAMANVVVTIRPGVARNCSIFAPCIVGRTSDAWELDVGGPGIVIERFDNTFDSGR
jgi:hypothetical protein